MKLFLSGRPKHTLTHDLETYARQKFGRLERYLPPASTVEVVLSDERGPKGGIDKKVRVTVVHPHQKNPLHVEEMTEDFRSSIDLAQDRTERWVRKRKEKFRDFHRRVLSRSQTLFADTARQTAAIPSWIWRAVRRQLSRNQK